MGKPRHLYIYLALILAVVGLLVLPALAGAAKSYAAERYDVQWTIGEDGSLAVTETMVFRFSGGPFTFVNRELPTRYSDGVVDISAAMDGRTLPAGSAAGQVEIGRGNPIKVRWHFAGVSDATHTFVLNYRVLGALRQESDADLLVWNALPTDYDYAIAAATLTVAYPPGTRLMEAPQVQRGRAQFATTEGRVTFSAADLRHDSPLTVALRFAPGSLISAPPAWQERAAEGRQVAPYFGAGALLVLLAGALGLVSLVRRSGHSPARGSSDLRSPMLPTDRPPAIAAALRSGGMNLSWAHGLATLFDLARRGALTIEESGERKWYRTADFTLQRVSGWNPGPTGLRPHESALLDLVFTSKAGPVDTVAMSDVAKRLPTKTSRFTKPLETEMRELGMFDDRREAVRRQLGIAGVLGLAGMVLAFVVGLLLVSRFGGWPMLLAGSVFVLSMLAFVLGAVHSPLTDEATGEAQSWRGFGLYLKDITKGHEPAYDLALFERYLPYAAGFGMLEPWVKAYQRAGGDAPPAWFRALSGADGHSLASFAAMSAAVHSAGNSGGAGSGGAGGGGSSGAG